MSLEAGLFAQNERIWWVEDLKKVTDIHIQLEADWRANSKVCLLQSNLESADEEEALDSQQTPMLRAWDLRQ